jgi:hypothetical protein
VNNEKTGSETTTTPAAMSAAANHRQTTEGTAMDRIRQPRRATPIELERAIEPLVSYICAAEQPKAVLDLAYSVLFNEVAQVHRAARAHVAGRAGRGPRKIASLVELSASRSTRI